MRHRVTYCWMMAGGSLGLGFQAMLDGSHRWWTSGGTGAVDT